MIINKKLEDIEESDLEVYFLGFKAMISHLVDIKIEKWLAKQPW